MHGRIKVYTLDVLSEATLLSAVRGIWDLRYNSSSSLNLVAYRKDPDRTGFTGDRTQNLPALRQQCNTVLQHQLLIFGICEPQDVFLQYLIMEPSVLVCLCCSSDPQDVRRGRIVRTNQSYVVQ